MRECAFFSSSRNNFLENGRSLYDLCSENYQFAVRSKRRFRIYLDASSPPPALDKRIRAVFIINLRILFWRIFQSDLRCALKIELVLIDFVALVILCRLPIEFEFLRTRIHPAIHSFIHYTHLSVRLVRTCALKINIYCGGGSSRRFLILLSLLDLKFEAVPFVSAILFLLCVSHLCLF